MSGSSLSSAGQSFYARTFSSAFYLAPGTPPTTLASSSLPKPQTVHTGWYDALVKPKTDALRGGGGEGGGLERMIGTPSVPHYQSIHPHPQHTSPPSLTDLQIPRH